MKVVLKSVLAGTLAFGGIFGVAGAPLAAAAVTFKDVPANHWAQKSIDAAVAKGYFKGYSDGTFRPGATVTRAEFASLLARVATGTPNTEQTKTFKDLAGHWSEQEVNRALSLGFLSVSDYPNGFKPSTAVTREEMAKWLSSGLAASDEDFKQALQDTKNTLVPVAEYYKGGLKPAAYPYVAVVLGTGLMSGYPDGTFGPLKTTTRAEAAVILSRYAQVQGSKATSYQDLNEMREVGLTGTNLISATPYEYFEQYDGTISSFDRVIGKTAKFYKNLGTITPHRMIVADARSKTDIRNIYGKMFIDPEYNGMIREDFYPAFIEVTVLPNSDKLNNLAFAQAVANVFTGISNFESGTTTTYGISNLPTDEFVESGFFKKGVPRKFWMRFNLKRTAGESFTETMKGFTVDKYTSTSFRIP